MDIKRIDTIVNYLKAKVSYTPDVLVILGSGLGSMAEHVENQTVVKYEDIPDFLIAGVYDRLDLLIYSVRDSVAIVSLLADISAEEDLVMLMPELYESQLVAHAKLRDHLASYLCRPFKIVARSGDRESVVSPPDAPCDPGAFSEPSCGPGSEPSRD